MKKIIATTLIVIMVLMVFPTEALALNVDEKITVKKSNPDPIPVRRDLRYSGQWDVKVKNSNVTQGIGVKDLLDNKDAPNYIFIPTSKISRSLVTSLGGNWDFVSSKYSALTTEVGHPNDPRQSEETIYITFLAHLCGADPGRWQANTGKNGGGYQEINTTPPPNINISAPSSAKTGESVKINISATTYVQFSHPKFTPATNLFADRIKVSVEIDGKEVHYDNVRSRNYSKTITYTFDEPGKYTIRATAEDVVERSKTTTATINVTGSSTPPSKPGNIKADLEMTLSPSQIKTGKTERVLVSLDASNVKTPGTGPIHYRWWVKKNGSYINPGGATGYKNEGDPSNPRYSLYADSCKAGDVIWAEVKAYDMSILKDATADTQRTIGELGDDPPDLPDPPPPEPPEPANKPPVARFSMPSRTGQGTTVDVINKSYDRDGEIVWVDWRISPRDGVEDDLGFDGGTITFNETGTYTVRLEVEDDRGDYDSTSDTIEVTNDPPEAIISCPDEVLQGEDVTIRSRSYDPDGEIASIEWEITPKEGVMGELEGEESEVWFDKVGEYKITLTVEDMFGLTDTAEKTITVKPAIPVAYFDYAGTLKENRKIILDASESKSTERYPIVWEDTQWEIIPPAGISPDNIKMPSNQDLKNPSVLIKKAGDYIFRVRVKNTAGHYSEWYERTLPVYPDLPPVADFYVQSAVLRDPTNGNNAKIELYDSSYSPDADQITQRIWRYKYDSNNDGSFEDETWQILDNGNNITPVLYTDQVGRYYFELEVKESFGEETIEEFIEPSDIRYGNTSSKPMNDKICEVLNLQPVVDFELTNKPKVDIVFTVGNIAETKSDALPGLIESIIKPKIAAENMDYTVTSIVTSTVTSQTSFPWEVYNLNRTGFGSGDGQFQADGTSYRYRGYGSEAPIDHLYYDDGKNAKREFTFNIDMTGYNACATIIPGFIFGANDTDRFRGYIALMWHDQVGVYYFDVVNHWALASHGAGQVARTRDPSSFGGTAVKIVNTKSQSLQKSFKMVYRDRTLEIYEDGVLLTTVHCPDAAGNGYGVAAANSSHGCGARSYIRFENFALKSSTEKSLNEALKSTTWREHAVRVVVNLSDVPLEELNDQQKRAQVLASLLSNDVYFVGLGINDNKSQYQTFIQLNDNKGAFFNTSNLNTALNQCATYIIDLVKSLSRLLQQYVLLGEEVIYKTYYIDPEQDAEYTREWYYDHDPDYFENSLGLAPYSGLPLSQSVNMFDKVGKFDVVFRAKDNPKNDNRFDNYRLWSYMPLTKLVLYVHRKPIAQYTSVLTENGDKLDVSLTSTSYDLDHMSKSNRGIVEEEWKWKEDTATTWNIGKPTTMPQDKIYLVWLRVKDEEGAWSDPYVTALSTLNENLPPVAMFLVNPSTQVEDKTLEIMDMSYDPNGDPIVEWNWRVQKDEDPWIDYGSTKPTDIPTLGPGVYTIELTVRDEPKTGRSLWSEPFTQTVTIIPENQKPVAIFTIGPDPIIADEPYTINDTSYDPDGDPIVAREWKVQKPDGTWHTVTELKPTFEEMGFDDDGIYKIQLRVLDDPSERHTALTPMWSDPYMVTVQVESPLKVIGDSDKDTYKAGQAMLLTAETEGKAYRVEAEMWYSKNEYASTNVTTLVPDGEISDPPPKYMTWHSRRTKEEGRDIVVIIPLNTPDGIYPVTFTAYKRRHDGSIKTATHTINVKVQGTIYDDSKTQIIGR